MRSIVAILVPKRPLCLHDMPSLGRLSQVRYRTSGGIRECAMFAYVTIRKLGPLPRPCSRHRAKRRPTPLSEVSTISLPTCFMPTPWPVLAESHSMQVILADLAGMVQSSGAREASFLRFASIPAMLNQRIETLIELLVMLGCEVAVSTRSRQQRKTNKLSFQSILDITGVHGRIRTSSLLHPAITLRESHPPHCHRGRLRIGTAPQASSTRVYLFLCSRLAPNFPLRTTGRP